MVASARHRGVRLGEKPAVPRISDLGHLYSSSLGKLELDMMGSQQMSERQVLEAIMAEAIAKVFEEYVEQHGLDEIVADLRQGREDRGRRHAAVSALCRALEARAEGLGQGVRGQSQRERRRAGVVRRVRPGRPVRHATASPARRSMAGSRMKSVRVAKGSVTVSKHRAFRKVPDSLRLNEVRHRCASIRPSGNVAELSTLSTAHEQPRPRRHHSHLSEIRSRRLPQPDARRRRTWCRRRSSICCITATCAA